jgi:thiol-disulfide isomerase/thioredoxin
MDEGSPAAARPSRRRAWVVLGVVALALGAAWFFTEGTQGPTVPPADGEKRTAAVGQPAPLQFTLKNLDGVDVKLASFEGKAILFNFWATWCEPCRDEIPDLVALHHQYGDRLTVVGVLVLDPVSAKTKAFVERYQMDYPVLNANDRPDVEDAYGPLIGFPTSVLVAPDGRVAARYSGPRRKEQFEKDILTVLQ